MESYIFDDYEKKNWLRREGVRKTGSYSSFAPKRIDFQIYVKFVIFQYASL